MVIKGSSDYTNVRKRWFFKEPLTELFFVVPKWFYGIAWITFWSTFSFKSVSCYIYIYIAWYTLDTLAWWYTSMIHICVYIYIYIQWGKKVFSQPPIVQVLPLKKREACNFHHRYTSTMRDKIRKRNPENHIVGFLRIYLQIMVENKYLVTYKQARLLALTDL